MLYLLLFGFLLADDLVEFGISALELKKESVGAVGDALVAGFGLCLKVVQKFLLSLPAPFVVLKGALVLPFESVQLKSQLLDHLISLDNFLFKGANLTG